ncbi:hypothetical protein [Aureispira anguillae]|uniref:Uncharacterized protein n=1 Tax=Aureispira anguillae TaxID=2864201 RepID=A0A916DX76_9BACT|nr:hypothetical protein [Aureispira anguillae]BDS14786.1 hypothetical protein AsAng_0055680 [Aureispira anguillae]
MIIRTCILLLALLAWEINLFAQRDDIVLTKEKKEFAFNSIKELKNGVLVVRLKTNQRKIEILERTLRDPNLTKQQRKRHQNILEGTIRSRDEFNQAIGKMFEEAFSFCPVYLMYDTNSTALTNGETKGLFLNKKGELDETIELESTNVFIVNYKKRSAEFPFDILRVRKLKEKLEDPFPYYVAIRESWINQVNTPRAAAAVTQLDKKMASFYQRALDYDKKLAERAARNAANKAANAKKVEG